MCAHRFLLIAYMVLKKIKTFFFLQLKKNIYIYLYIYIVSLLVPMNIMEARNLLKLTYRLETLCESKLSFHLFLPNSNLFIYIKGSLLDSFLTNVYLCQCRLALKPDGIFLGAILGGETLKLPIPFHLFLYLLI